MIENLGKMGTNMEKELTNAKNPMNVFVGRNLRYFIEKQNISEQELADSFHIEKDSLKRILNGTNGISGEYLHILLTQYGCDLNFLFGGTDFREYLKEGDATGEKQDAEIVTKESIARQIYYIADLIRMLE